MRRNFLPHTLRLLNVEDRFYLRFRESVTKIQIAVLDACDAS
ncbi:hypothetical protein [Nonlabens sp.]